LTDTITHVWDTSLSAPDDSVLVEGGNVADVKVTLDSEAVTLNALPTGTNIIGGVELVDEVGVLYGVKHIQNKPRVSSMPYTYDIAEGNIDSHRSWSKIGYNGAVGTTEEEMWPVSAPYVFPTAALTMTIVSDSAKDCQRALTAFANSANHPGVNTLVTCAAHGLADGDIVIISGTTSYNGTFTIEHTVAGAFEIIKVYVANDATGIVRGPGANTITIYYLDYSFVEHVETKTLLGTTAVQIGTDVYRVNNARLSTVGNSLVPVGNITIASGGVTYGYISAGRTRMRQCIWTVPVNKTLYITQISFSCAEQEAIKYCRFTTKANYDNISGVVLQRGLWSPYNEVFLNNAAYIRELNPPTKLPATVDLKVSVMASATAFATCSLRGWLEDEGGGV
jgi:hypothetical protein